MLITKDTKVVYRNENGEEIEFSSFSVYYPEKIEEEVKNNITTSKSSSMHGENYVSNTLESRYITISGFIERSNSAPALRKRLIKTINPTLKAKLIYSNATEVKEIECMPEEIPVVEANGGLIRFDINLQSFNPFWKNKEKVEQLAVLTGKLTFPLVIPKTSGMLFGLKKSILENEVNNIGDVISGFRVVFKAKGSTSNPKIYNKLTGEFIKINYSMSKGDVIEIINYPEQKKITVNGTENGFKYLDIDSTFFNLEIGKNIIGYIAEENTINLEVIMYYTPRYLEV